MMKMSRIVMIVFAPVYYCIVNLSVLREREEQVHDCVTVETL